MKLVAAYLLATLGGNASPKADDIKNILSSVGATYDEDRVSKLLAELQGKDVQEVISEGKSQLAEVPVGGAAAAAGGAAAAGAAPEAAEEEKKEETEEESDDDMGMDLFG